MDLKTQVDDKPEEKKTPGVQKIRTKKCEQKQCVQRRKAPLPSKWTKQNKKKNIVSQRADDEKNMEEEQIFCQVYIH